MIRHCFFLIFAVLPFCGLQAQDTAISPRYPGAGCFEGEVAVGATFGYASLGSFDNDAAGFCLVAESRYNFRRTPFDVGLRLGVSSKLPVEALQDLYEGIAFACKEQEIDLVGGDTRASMTGLVITVTTLGYAKKEKVVYRSGAQQNDLVCITGNLGAAYMGLQLLEREKRVLADVENPEPQFKGYEYLLEKYLKPRPRTDIVRALAEEKIRPTSMIDLSDGLASDLMQLCKSSACGARIYLERIPIARQTSALAEEMHSDPVVAALNGGEDYELLFTVPLSMQEQIMRLGLVDVIGHITPASTGCYLVTPDGQDIKLKAQGFPEE